MTESVRHQLPKVATEFNQSIKTVAEYLSSLGHAVEAKPTARISQEMYELVAAKFSTDKQLKDEARQLSEQRLRDRESVVIAKQQTKPVQDDWEEQVLIKNAASIEKQVTPAEIPVIVTPPVEEPAVINLPEEKPADVKIVTPIAEVPVPLEVPPSPEEVPVTNEEKEVDSGKKLKGPKVIGKIDESRLESRSVSKKSKKTKVEPKPELETKPVAREESEPVKKEVIELPPVVMPDTEPEPEPEKKVITPNYQKLQGIKVMGKIDLPVEEPKKPDGEKKKRKRKIATVTSTDDPKLKVEAQRSRYERDRPRDRKPADGKEENKPAEITDKQVQDQLKRTLAKLQPGAKQNIGSVRGKVRRQKRDLHALNREEAALEKEKESKIIKVTEFVSANELAKMMDVSPNEVIMTCFNLGMAVSINQRLDAEVITLVADEFGYEVQFVDVEVNENLDTEEDDPADLKPRAPIVTVMGHVDHGKTSLLDNIRKTNVIAGEAGGITQHIGAYEVKLKDGKKIAFLDTPGHEAFTAMRARGAQITDIVIIVIAADDSVMPQTKEAINHAQAAGVPIVFAFNKIDKEGANPDKIREQLSAMNILVEEWGGKYQTQEISAKAGLNIDLLLEKVLLEAEILDLKANPGRRAAGTVIEARMDKGRGVVATIMVQNGTLRVGDPLVAGVNYGRVRALFNERGQKLSEAGPSTPVQMLGFAGTPQAGDKFYAMSDEAEAKEIANKRQQLQREQGLRTQKHITLDEIGRRLAIGNFKELNLIVKADVDGSAEALSDALLKLSTSEIQVNVILKSVGQISESDVLLASASDAIIIGFQVRPSAQARKLAEAEDIDIRHYSIIYEAIEEVKSAMEGLLSPEIKEQITGNIDVREVFKISKVGTIAGCYVTDGKVNRNSKIRVVRDGIVIHSGSLDSLKRFKDDVKEVSAGYECGLMLKNFNDIQVGDTLEVYEEIEVKRKL